MAGDDPLAAALEIAYRHLGRRDSSEAQLRAHLIRRGVEPDVVDVAVSHLGERGYLDDARFAQRLAAERRMHDGWGGERIAAALRRAGIAPEHVAAALAERSAEDELAGAVALLRRRLAAPPADDRDRRRALALLVRRGYELELAYEAVRELARTDGGRVVEHR
jgi:regulatory protein